MTNVAYEEPPVSAETAAPRRGVWSTKAAQRILTLLPGVALLFFWQWSAGRLIKEIYVSKPTAVAQRLH
jgi:NitT/TauT family transport system permease protein